MFLCGTGNNGGDGLAAARIFFQRGGQAEIWLSGAPKTPDAISNWKWARALGIPMMNLRELPESEMPFCGKAPRDPFDGYVDALLGTGMKGRMDALTERMALAPMHAGGHRPVIAVDIPSGMDGLTGEIFDGACVRADVTVTFHAPKPGLLLTKNREAVGRLVTADIGLWQMPPLMHRKDMQLSGEMIAPGALGMLSSRALNAHKGDCGRILIYAGSMGMAGAAAMCARAAIAAGAGLTTVVCPREIMPILQTLAPNAMCMDVERTMQNPPAYDVLAVGCGLSQNDEIWAQILKLYDPEKPAIWDADALNLLARHPMKLGKQTVITPHPGEAARLLGWRMEQVLENRLEAARALCEMYHCITVLKSDVTVIAGLDDENRPSYVFHALGSPALAKGGSGDALAGIMAVCAHEKNLSRLHAAAIACLWHGMAGVIGEETYGQRELTTAQLIDCLHAAEAWGQKENGLR